jgi:hypothetical protein
VTADRNAMRSSGAECAAISGRVGARSFEIVGAFETRQASDLVTGWLGNDEAIEK